MHGIFWSCLSYRTWLEHVNFHVALSNSWTTSSTKFNASLWMIHKNCYSWVMVKPPPTFFAYICTEKKWGEGAGAFRRWLKFLEQVPFDDSIWLDSGPDFSKLAWMACLWFLCTWQVWMLSDNGGGQSYWSRLSLMSISNLILVITSPKLHGWSVLWNLYIWQAWMLNLRLMFQMLEEVKAIGANSLWWLYLT